MTENPIVGPLQMRVLEFLWRNGPSTIHQIAEAVNAEADVTLAYTTILTVSRNLVRRRVCQQRATGQRQHMFSPLVTREEYRAAAASWLIRTQFQGDVTAAIHSVSTASP